MPISLSYTTPSLLRRKPWRTPPSLSPPFAAALTPGYPRVRTQLFWFLAFVPEALTPVAQMLIGQRLVAGDWHDAVAYAHRIMRHAATVGWAMSAALACSVLSGRSVAALVSTDGAVVAAATPVLALLVLLLVRRRIKKPSAQQAGSRIRLSASCCHSNAVLSLSKQSVCQPLFVQANRSVSTTCRASLFAPLTVSSHTHSRGVVQPVAAALFSLEGVLIGMNEARYLAAASLGASLIAIAAQLLFAATGSGLLGVWAAVLVFYTLRIALLSFHFVSLTHKTRAELKAGAEKARWQALETFDSPQFER